MFVSVIIEPGSIDSGEALVSLMIQSGFQKIQKSCWENMKISEHELNLLKKNIDSVTDYYDKIRLYQFPVNGMFVITELKQKKWRKCQFKSGAASPQNSANTKNLHPVHK